MKTIKIIKIGGNIINDATQLNAFLEVFSKIEGPKMLVHGGGKLATETAKNLGLEAKMIDGRRVTDKAMLDVVTMVYAGQINKNIVTKLQALNTNSVGFSGADGNTIVSTLRPNKPIDYDVTKVNIEVLEALLKLKITPVFCALTHNNEAQLLNTNADTIASESAIAFAKNYITELYYCFEKPGVLKDVNDDSSVITSIDFEAYQNLKANNIIFEGMIPKLDNCFHAIKSIVKKVCIGLPNMLKTSETNFTTLH